MEAKVEKPKKLKELQEKTCGIIIPIAGSEKYSENHWLDIKKIIEDTTESSETYDFKTKIVSESEDAGILQDNIVNGIYYSDIIICDVSSKNPNVLFELGMRLAFDKPVVIIKDDKTNIMFDINVIEYIEYPSNLNYVEIERFKNRLIKKIENTMRKSADPSSNSSYLSKFGNFEIQNLSDTQISSSEAIETLLYQTKILNNKIDNLENKNNHQEDEVNNKYLIKNIVNSIEKYCSNFNIYYNDLDYSESLKEHILTNSVITKFVHDERSAIHLILRCIAEYQDEQAYNELPF